MCHARDGFSLFQYKKFNYRDSSSVRLPDDVLYHIRQFFFVTSKHQRMKIEMIERLWRWHNTVDTLPLVPDEDGSESTLSNDFSSLKVQ